MKRKKCWLHRCTCGDHAWPFTYELLVKHNIISIGWNDFSDENYQERLSDSMKSFADVFQKEWGYQPRNRYNLWRFLNGMKKGDIVVVPMDGGTFSIYKISDNMVYNNETFDHNLWIDWNGDRATLDQNGYPTYSDGRIIDMGFYRKVEPLRLNISRDEYATQALYSRMKIRQTNADISDLMEEVCSVLEHQEPINLKSAFVSSAAEILSNQMRDLMNDRKIEELVRWYMESLGAVVYIPAKNTTKTNEGDADVVATFDKLNNHTILIQVKAHSGFTDSWAVEQIALYAKTFEDSLEDRSTQLWVISTCEDFTEETKRLASEKGIFLINGRAFAEMLIDNGLYSLPV